jgi:hypothetical protein
LSFKKSFSFPFFIALKTTQKTFVLYISTISQLSCSNSEVFLSRPLLTQLENQFWTSH